MKIWTENSITVIQAEVSKWLHKEDIYTQDPVFLGKFDRPENWEEVEEKTEEGV